MKTYSLPAAVRGLIFDVDSTLYTCDAYARAQVLVQIERLAERRGVGAEAMEAELEAYRDAWSRDHGGRKLSMGNAFVAFGVPIEESVRWREELVAPEDYLERDPELRSALSVLAAAAPLAVVTNNPVLTGRRTLAALGVEDLFIDVVGLDSCGVSKPHAAPFLRAAAALGAEPAACVAIGDRYDIDVALPLELGMGGVLVDGVRDVYALPALLEGRLSAKTRA